MIDQLRDKAFEGVLESIQVRMCTAAFCAARDDGMQALARSNISCSV